MSKYFKWGRGMPPSRYPHLQIYPEISSWRIKSLEMGYGIQVGPFCVRYLKKGKNKIIYW